MRNPRPIGSRFGIVVAFVWLAGGCGDEAPDRVIKTTGVADVQGAAIVNGGEAVGVVYFAGVGETEVDEALLRLEDGKYRLRLRLTVELDEEPQALASLETGCALLVLPQQIRRRAVVRWTGTGFKEPDSAVADFLAGRTCVRGSVKLRRGGSSPDP